MSQFWLSPFWPAAQKADCPHSDNDEPAPGARQQGGRFRERRRARRYPIKLELAYQVAETRGGQTGRGETVDISSKALLFTAETQPPIGSTIEAVMRWPVEVGEETPLRLVISGPVLRRDARGAVVLIKRFEFFQHAEPGPEERPGEPHGFFGKPKTRSAR